MKRRQKDPAEVKAELILNKVKEMEKMSPEQKLGYVRKIFKDANINIGYQTAMLILMTELMVYWEETDENMVDFIARHKEFLEVFQSEEEEDKKQLVRWMDELEERTGYSPLGDVVSCLDQFREVKGYE